jgi:hypothetical protein
MIAPIEPIFTRSAGPVGGSGLTCAITGVGVGVAVGAVTTVVVVPPPTVIVKEQFVELLTVFSASVKVAVALKVPAVA